MMRSATRTRKSTPPATSIADAAMITVSTISSTAPGTVDGAWPKPTTSTSSPTAPHRPRPTPPVRAPMARAARTTANSRISWRSMASSERIPGDQLDLVVAAVLGRHGERRGIDAAPVGVGAVPRQREGERPGRPPGAELDLLVGVAHEVAPGEAAGGRRPVIVEGHLLAVGGAQADGLGDVVDRLDEAADALRLLQRAVRLQHRAPVETRIDELRIALRPHAADDQGEGARPAGGVGADALQVDAAVDRQGGIAVPRIARRGDVGIEAVAAEVLVEAAVHHPQATAEPAHAETGAAALAGGINEPEAHRREAAQVAGPQVAAHRAAAEERPLDAEAHHHVLARRYRQRQQRLDTRVAAVGRTQAAEHGVAVDGVRRQVPGAAGLAHGQAHTTAIGDDVVE